jgi:hypothetical protein
MALASVTSTGAAKVPVARPRRNPGAAVGLRRRDRGRLQEHVGPAVAVEVADRGPVASLGQGGADRGRRQRGGAREATGAAADDVARLGDGAVL